MLNLALRKRPYGKQNALVLILCVSLLLCALPFLQACSSSATSKASENSTQAQQTGQTGEAEQEVLKLGFVPLLDSEKLVDEIKPLEAALSKELNRPVEAFVASSYVGVVQALNSGQIQMAYIPPLAYVLAHEESGAQCALVALNAKGESSYKSESLVRKDSSIQSLADLKAKRVAFVDPSSTSGYLFPASMIKEQGIDLEKDLNLVFSGGHDKSLQLLLNSEVDAIGSFAGISKRYAKDFPEAPEQTRVLATSQAIPSVTLAFNKDLPEDLGSQIKAAFIKISKDEQGAAMLKELFNIHGFTEAQDSDYEAVRSTAKLMDIDLAAIK